MKKVTFSKSQSFKRWNMFNAKYVRIASTVTIFVDGKPWGEIRRQPKARYWNVAIGDDYADTKTISCNTTLTDAKNLVKEYISKNL